MGSITGRSLLRWIPQRLTLTGVAILVLYSTSVAGVQAEEAPIEASYHGVKIEAWPVPAGAYYDEHVISADRAIERIREALDLIDRKSSFAASALNKLGKSGHVIVIYDPRFQPTSLNRSSATLAAYIFDPHIEHGSRGAESYPIVVGPHIVKWTTEVLASVLVHELVHSIQHKEGRLRSSSRLDIECEASLHQERALQGFGADKHSRQVVGFRRQFQLKSCIPFIQYMKANTPTKVELWNTLNPDVPQLLSIFDKYLGAK